MELLRSLTVEDTALRVNPFAPGMLPWGLRFLRNCTEGRFTRNTLRMLRLSQYSQGVMDELTEREGIAYDDVHEGMLYLYHDAKQFEAGIRKMRIFREHGQRQEFLDPEGIARVEPAFAGAKDKLVGAIYGVTDATGDSVKFCHGLAAVARRLGVQFVLNTEVTSFATKGSRVYAARTKNGDLGGDLFVLAAGCHSPQLSGTAGIRLPIVPAKGYSATFSIENPAAAPRLGGVDQKWLVAWSRQGNRLRMTSSVHFSGFSRSWKPRDFRGIVGVAQELMPSVADYAQGAFRACLRPMTADGPPILGRARYENLFFNTGHGQSGFAMACGSSKIVVDLMSGRTPELDTEGLTLESRR
jgi:D-amino-acid dehydrogenase